MFSSFDCLGKPLGVVVKGPHHGVDLNTCLCRLAATRVKLLQTDHVIQRLNRTDCSLSDLGRSQEHFLPFVQIIKG